MRTVGYDHLGAGETPAQPGDLSFGRQLDAVFDLLDALRIERCVLAGESNGGTVAMAAALGEPGRFSGLILVDSPHSGFDNPQTRGFIEGLKADFPGTIRSDALGT